MIIPAQEDVMIRVLILAKKIVQMHVLVPVLLPVKMTVPVHVPGDVE